jgi:hypothetical protein
MTNSPRSTAEESLADDRFDGLVHAYFDEQLDQAMLAELEATLKDSAAARRRFWALAEVHGLARLAARVALGNAADLATAAEPTAGAEPRAFAAAAPIGHSDRRWPGPSAAAAVVMAFLLALGGLAAGRWWQPAARIATPPATVPLATIAKVRSVVPRDSARPLVAGAAVPAGPIGVAAGCVEITVRNGVVIVLEGPGELELLGEMAAFLHSGKAVVRMPKGMSGFRLDTTTTDVLDLGTEFAVKTGQGLVTEVQVYDGEVLATRKAGETGMQFPKRLVAGEAVRFDAKQAGLPEPIPYSEGRFVRHVPATAGVELEHVTEPEEQIRQFGRMLFDSIPVMPAKGPVAIDGDLADWHDEPGFKAARHPAARDDQFAAGWMMYDADHLYIAAHVGDPYPLRNVIDPELDPELGWQGGGLQVRLSLDRAMGWPADANAPHYYALRRTDPPAAERVKAENPRISHLTMWHHAPSGKACITVAQGMNPNALAVNPPGVVGGFRRDADGQGYVVEYAIPWRVLHAEDDPPQRGDTLAAVWQVHWSDETGRLWRDQLVEIRNPHEPRRIVVYERAATWGRAEFR